jgi:hypothetical protein
VLTVSREAVRGIALLTPWEGLGHTVMSGLFVEVSSHTSCPLAMIRSAYIQESPNQGLPGTNNPRDPALVRAGKLSFGGRRWVSQWLTFLPRLRAVLYGLAQ